MITLWQQIMVLSNKGFIHFKQTKIFALFNSQNKFKQILSAYLSEPPSTTFNSF